MKKVLAICLVIVMLASVSVCAFAAPNGFVSSPGGNGAPTVEKFVPKNDDCTARLVITPYSDRDDLSAALQAMIEKAYDSIVNSKDLTELNAELAKIAKDKKIDGKNLAVSDLFDIHVAGCDYHDDHVDFDVTLDAETLKHFVGLLHMNKDGQWELVTNAKVINNYEHLQFSVESFSPFAIVVDTTVQDTPTTGDSPMIYVFMAIMAVSAAAVVVLLIKAKKQKA